MTLSLGITKYTIESVRAASNKLPKTVLFGSEGNTFCVFCSFFPDTFLERNVHIFISSKALKIKSYKFCKFCAVLELFM